MSPPKERREQGLKMKSFLRSLPLGTPADLSEKHALDGVQIDAQYGWDEKYC